MFIVLGFAVVLATQVYWNFGPKPGADAKKAFVGPPKPIYLTQNRA
jgi:hypothetical protein